MIKDIPLIKKSCNYRADNWPNGYRVTSAGYDIFSACCRAVPSRCGLYNEGKPYNPPRNGIRSQLKNSNKCNVEAKVPKEIPLNEFSLRRYLKRLQQSGNHRNMISQIEYLLTLAKASKSGLLPITYVQSNGGRLYAEGAVNLQNCKREMILPSNSGHATKWSKLSTRGDSHDKTNINHQKATQAAHS